MSTRITDASTMRLQLPPLSLYVHIPWCVRKCPYCDFNSHQRQGALPEQAYIDALLRDLEQSLVFVQGRQLQSIFIGGGTPSLLSAASFDRLLSSIAGRMALAQDIEITLEANPGTAEREKFADYHRAGINRLSIGVQSFDDLQLQQLGRIHGSEDARRAVEMARSAGFDNLNLDLMYGLQAQNSAAALRDLQQAIALQPEHLSWYQLTIEPNTEFYKQPPSLPQEEALIDIQEHGLALLQEQGYVRYEISAFAREARQARHNLNYWRFGDYLGIGAGAHGKITQVEQGCILRTRTARQPEHYLQRAGNGFAECTAIAQSDLAIEYLLNVLRLREGFTVSSFEASTGLGFEHIEKQVLSLTARELLAFDGDRIRPTARGEQFLNSVLEAFL
ncbi:MAG: radical SAM family heme chaperone HemW [Gammaproteobacteria bacterium]